MSLGKIYYDPKHTAAFSSAAKLVSAAKSNKKKSKSGCQVKTRTLCINLYVKDFLEIHIL